MITNGVMAEKVKALEEENERLAQALVNIAGLVEQEVADCETQGKMARAQEARLIRWMVLAEMENATKD